jgi:hypothetical protein
LSRPGDRLLVQPGGHPSVPSRDRPERDSRWWNRLSVQAGVGAGVGALRRSCIEAGAFLLALALMLAAAIRLRLAPTGSLLRAMGQSVGAVACAPLVDARGVARARLVRRSIRWAARVSPLRSDCLPQALAAATLCRWLMVPVALHLGVRRETKGQGRRPLEAHAWVTAGPVAVSGGDGFESFVAVACFLSHPPDSEQVPGADEFARVRRREVPAALSLSPDV